MKNASKVLVAAGLSAAMTACSQGFPDYEHKYNQTAVHEGITANSLDDRPGTVSHAIIYAPAHYKTGVDTIAQVNVGSVRACFTQAVDAASVNAGNYRVDCIGPQGDIVDRFSVNSEWWRENKPSGDGNKVTIEHTLRINSQRLP